MTSPQYAPVQQTLPPQQQGLTPTEEAVIAALALFFASLLAVNALGLPASLVQRLVALGLTKTAILAAATIALTPPLSGRGRAGSPTSRASTARAAAADEPEMRARYVLAAAKRLTEAETRNVFDEAVRVEQTYLQRHRQAGRNRARAAAALDEVAAAQGPWLVWRTQNDGRVESECRALSGQVFTIDNPPDGLIPGAVHPHCRCYATGLASTFRAAPTVTNR